MSDIKERLRQSVLTVRTANDALTEIERLEAELERWKRPVEDVDTAIVWKFTDAKEPDAFVSADLARRLAAQNRELQKQNESLRAQCGLRQIQGYHEGQKELREQHSELQQLYGIACERLQELGEKTVSLVAKSPQQAAPVVSVPREPVVEDQLFGIRLDRAEEGKVRVYLEKDDMNAAVIHLGDWLPDEPFFYSSGFTVHPAPSVTEVTEAQIDEAIGKALPYATLNHQEEIKHFVRQILALAGVRVK